MTPINFGHRSALASMDEGDDMTTPELEQSNKTDWDLDGLDDRKAPPISVPGAANETYSLRPFEPIATQGPLMGQYFAPAGVGSPTADLAAVGA
jgi:hypothetical protein